MVSTPEAVARRSRAPKKHESGSGAVRRAALGARFHALVALLFAGWCAAAAGEPRATLDRNPIRADETVRLIIEMEGNRGEEKPNLNALDREFERLGSSTSTQIQILNGKQSATTRWIVELAPRRSGELTVPSLTLGGLSTPALILSVLDAPESDEENERDIFIETEVFPRAPYVQSQVSYALRLFRAVEILDGTLEEPRAGDAIVQRLGRDTGYATTRGGREYRVIERRYAIFPQSSGDLHIPPVRFDGEIADPSAGSSNLSRLFMQGRRVRLRTEEYSLQVRPRPAHFEGQTWLPARALHIVEQWSEDPPELSVGEPLTRTVTLKATGLRGDQLPEIEIGSPDGVRVYPDQPTIRTATDAELVYGSREQRFALVALSEGEVTFPEIRVRWWDSVKDAPAEAHIPSRTFVAGAAPLETAGLVGALSNPELDTGAERVPIPKGSGTAAAGVWQWISAALLALWGVTVFAWWRSRRGIRDVARKDSRGPRIARARRALRSACAAGRAEEARDALLEWASAAWPEESPHSLGEAARRVEAGLATCLRELDRSLYAPTEDTWNGEALWREAKTGLRRSPRPARSAATSGLAPLYPERPDSAAQRSSG